MERDHIIKGKTKYCGGVKIRDKKTVGYVKNGRVTVSSEYRHMSCTMRSQCAFEVLIAHSTEGKGQGSWMQQCIIILNSTRWVEKYDTTLLNQLLKEVLRREIQGLKVYPVDRS